jgi:hypothetical protein
MGRWEAAKWVQKTTQKKRAYSIVPDKAIWMYACILWFLVQGYHRCLPNKLSIRTWIQLWFPITRFSHSYWLVLSHLQTMCKSLYAYKLWEWLKSITYFVKTTKKTHHTVTWFVKFSYFTWRGVRYKLCVRINKLGQLGWQVKTQLTPYILIVIILTNVWPNKTIP